MAGHNDGAIVLGDQNLFALAAKATLNKAKKHPKISVAWIIGLLFSILATGFTPAQEDVRQYTQELRGLEQYDPLLLEVSTSHSVIRIVDPSLYAVRPHLHIHHLNRGSLSTPTFDATGAVQQR